MAMRVAIYTRVSTSDQSVGRQMRELREYATKRGWDIILEVEEVASGASKNRPQREEVLCMARKRKIDAVLILSLDRWGRSVQDLVLTMAELQELGVDFVVPGNIDMTTPMGKMLAHFLGAVAEFERELIRERVKSGLENARAKGKQLGRPRANTEEGLMLIEQGMPYAKVAKQTGVSISTLLRAKRRVAPSRNTGS